MLTEKAGLTPDAVVDVLNDQTRRSDGKLDLWGKIRLERAYIRQCLRFELGDNAVMMMGQVGLGWGRMDHLFPHSFDTDQVEALIAKLTRKPKSQSARQRS
jgi:hypothetical protein